jgi:cobalt transporter subunit CbtB
MRFVSPLSDSKGTCHVDHQQQPSHSPQPSHVHLEPTPRPPLSVLSILGACLVYFAGLFSHIEAVHNAAHDTRHSAAFPCH